METADSPDVVVAKQLLDYAKQDGFTFQRVAPGEDAPLVGYRLSDDWVDLIHIEGFSRDCFAWRKRTSALIVSPDARMQPQVEGSALDVPKSFLVHTHRHDYQYAAPGRGRTRITVDPDQLIWVLLARESTDRERQIDNQLSDLRAQVARIGGRIEREIPENAVSAFKWQRVALPDGTCGYRVVRPEWEKILTALRRGECNALMVPDIDRAMRDPRTLEDLIDAVELYGVYVASLTGNMDLTTDAGISAARSLVNQRNQESRNTSRRVVDGHRHSAMEGRPHGGAKRPFGWRKDRVRLNKREAAHIRRELPRILAG